MLTLCASPEYPTFLFLPLVWGPPFIFLTDALTFCDSSVLSLLRASLCTRAPAWVTFSLEAGWARVWSALPSPRWPHGAPYCTRHDWSTFLILGFASSSLKHPSRFACSLLKSVHIFVSPPSCSPLGHQGGFLGLLLPSALSTAFSPLVLSWWCRQSPPLSPRSPTLTQPAWTLVFLKLQKAFESLVNLVKMQVLIWESQARPEILHFAFYLLLLVTLKCLAHTP